MSHNQLYSGCMLWQGQSNQYCTNPLPLHYSTLTRLITRHCTHLFITRYTHRSISAVHWARKP